MEQIALIAGDVVGITALTWTYFRRHRRRDLVVAFLGVNVGVLAVASTLGSSSIGAGLGLGLFGVLSIIRLRSTEIDQREVAYYFASLALGILGALPGKELWHSLVFMAMLVGAVLVADHPRILRRHQRQELVLDGAVLDRVALVARLEGMLGARVHQVAVQRVDLVNDTTWVDVRYEAVPPTRRRVHAQSTRDTADVPTGAAP